MKVRSKLQALMAVRQIDQKSLAAQTGLSPTTVGKIYRNHFDRVDNHTVVALYRFFGLKSLDELFEVVGEDEQGTG